TLGQSLTSKFSRIVVRAAAANAFFRDPGGSLALNGAAAALLPLGWHPSRVITPLHSETSGAPGRAARSRSADSRLASFSMSRPIRAFKLRRHASWSAAHRGES